jgi:hypothetical protein
MEDFIVVIYGGFKVDLRRVSCSVMVVLWIHGGFMEDLCRIYG